MEIKSEPVYTEEPIRLLDVEFVASPPTSLTLRAADTITVIDEGDNPRILIEIMKPRGSVFIPMRNITVFSLREDVARTVVKGGPSPSAIASSEGGTTSTRDGE